MAKVKSPTGIVRAELDIDGARAALGELHEAVGEGWDVLREGRQRSEQARQAEASRRRGDGTRAPVLTKRKAGDR